MAGWLSSHMKASERAGDICINDTMQRERERERESRFQTFFARYRNTRTRGRTKLWPWKVANERVNPPARAGGRFDCRTSRRGAIAPGDGRQATARHFFSPS